MRQLELIKRAVLANPDIIMEWGRRQWKMFVGRERTDIGSSDPGPRKKMAISHETVKVLPAKLRLSIVPT